MHSRTKTKHLTVKTSSTRDVDHPAELLLTEQRPCSLGTGEGALEMDLNDLVPLLVRHVLETIAEGSANVRG